MTAASDAAAAWTFPVPVLSPAGNPVPGQTLTAQANRSLNAEPPFLAMGLVAGNRVLIRETVGGGGFGGLWVVTVLGDATHPWKLTRTTDADTLAELPNGTLVIATAVLETGVTYNRPLIQLVAGLWRYVPNVTDFLTILNSMTVGTGLSSPSLNVLGGLLSDTVTANTTLSGPTSAIATPNVNNGGTATFSGKACRYTQVGNLVVFRLVFQVTANGSGAVAVTVTGTALPQMAGAGRCVGDRAGVGVLPLFGRYSNVGGELTISTISTASVPATALTGADLLSGSSYQFTGAYLTT